MSHPQLQRRRQDLAWWQAQADQVAAHRRQLRYIPLVALPLAGLSALAHPLAGAAVIATAVLLGLMGMYMTRVRDDEFAGHVAEARQDVQRLEAELAAAPAADAAAADSPVGHA